MDDNDVSYTDGKQRPDVTQDRSGWIKCKNYNKNS